MFSLCAEKVFFFILRENGMNCFAPNPFTPKLDMKFFCKQITSGAPCLSDPWNFHMFFL